MKIGMVCNPSMSGAGIVTVELGKLLAERGHEVHFISYQLPYRLDVNQPNVYFHQVRLVDNLPIVAHDLYDVALASQIVRIVEERELDLLHAHYAIPNSIASVLANNMLEKPVGLVTTVHGTDVSLLGDHPVYHRPIQYALRESDAVTAVSHSLQFDLQHKFAFEQPVQPIYNFVDRRVFYSQKQPPYRVGESPVLIHISNFRPIKRIADVISIFEQVQERIPSARLLMVGDGPELASAKQQVGEAGLSEQVEFTGLQTEVASLLARSDLFLLPSENESFGLVALEAMACGVPVIGSEIGGIPEVVEHGKTGYVAEVGNIDRMARYAVHLLENNHLYSSFVTHGLEKVVTDFCAEHVVEQYEEVYHQVLGGSVGKDERIYSMSCFEGTRE